MKLMFGGLFSRKDSVLVIDMGSASVGVAVVVYDPDAEPFVAYSTRIPLAIQEKLEPTKFVKMMRSYLSQALDRVHTHAPANLKPHGAPANISDVYVTFASPWYTTAIHTAHESFQEPRAVTGKFIQHLVTNAESGFDDEEKNYFTSERFDSKPKLIEHEVTDVLLNGYQTSTPIGKKAHDLEVNIFMSAIPESVAETVESAIGEYFDISTLTFHTQPHVIYRATSRYMDVAQDTLIFDIGGDRTDIAAVRSGAIQHVYSFAFGTNDLIRRVSIAFDTGYELAASFVTLYQEGKADEKLAEQLDDTIRTIVDDWVKQCQAVLTRIREDQYWSRRAVIVASKDVADIFTTLLRETADNTEKMSQTFVQIDQETLEHSVMYADDSQFDTFLALEALFVAYQRS